MLGLREIGVLLIVGLIVVAVGFVGGLRGLYQPYAKPFFLRRRSEGSSKMDSGKRPHSGVKKRRRNAA